MNVEKSNINDLIEYVFTILFNHKRCHTLMYKLMEYFTRLNMGELSEGSRFGKYIEEKALRKYDRFPKWLIKPYGLQWTTNMLLVEIDWKISLAY